ncbi:hypothetical protein A3A36_03020 [Candidatus Kaiserbacteria bacterium RIFCSPLOWO2_01_FULL_52_12b]|uniref:Ribbon-helix-helix protein CopG domain-containing protein n=1 Tax=Candidatus Kaiserbacteria bacterium RIFCSPLOWO2_01_FULL_52_12b TaxID=1798509 RepID=A0A1F6EXF2_9BACT|nr:MAG: hypothetical protein A3A36_03020 [Candidatus Kaiserbacteria bacterium RIFCSPLOWO2_01_FULL_52_12b]
MGLAKKGKWRYDKIILNYSTYMSTLSVPLTPKLEGAIDNLVRSGYAPTKSEVVRRAITRLAEEEAVQDVLKAMREPMLKGDLRDLMKKIR